MIALAPRLQTTLEHLYRIEGVADVVDYRVDRAMASLLLGTSAVDALRESLLVHQAGDETEIALFLCDDVEAEAHRFVCLPSVGGLDAFCVALEGVSHFVYFTFCGGRQDRSVSRVELELQAEIDKFLVLRALLGVPGDELLSRLFERFTFDDDLSDDDRGRYRFANRHGRRYARWLDRQFSTGRGAEALDDARRLYRRPLEDKLSFIARPH